MDNRLGWIDPDTIPYGFCKCGCGQQTAIETRYRPGRMYTKGQPRKYLRGHNRKMSGPEYRIDETVGCWVWQRAFNSVGYPMLAKPKYGSRLAHRAFYQHRYGVIDPSLHVCHHCDRPACVNPEHLFVGTARDNMKDMVTKGRQAKHKPNLQGSKNHQSILTESDVVEIRELYRQGLKQTEIAPRYGVTNHCICLVVNRKSWTHVP